MATWQNCSTDGRLCYVCSNDGGPCICNWFYDRNWIATTDCGSGFSTQSLIEHYSNGTVQLACDMEEAKE